MRKGVFGADVDREGTDQPVHQGSDQGLHCLLTESLDTTEYMNGEPGQMIVCTCCV